MLLTQHFPDTDGLELPTLEQVFQLHSGEFVQLLNVPNSHWIVVSNLGCDKDVVNVYDTMYPSIPSSTSDTIACLVFCHSATLTIKMVDVDKQSNSSDCGVLSLAVAYDLLCAQAPCVTKYDHSLIREHLCECLTKSSFSEFPARGERSLRPIQYGSVVKLDIFCICRLPEHQDEEWAECEKCLKWFHRYCPIMFSMKFRNPGCAQFVRKHVFSCCCCFFQSSFLIPRSRCGLLAFCIPCLLVLPLLCMHVQHNMHTHVDNSHPLYLN